MKRWCKMLSLVLTIAMLFGVFSETVMEVRAGNAPPNNIIGTFGPIIEEIKNGAQRDCLWPIENTRWQTIQCCFYETDRYHYAIDMPAPWGEPVIATYDGKVVQVGNNPGRTGYNGMGKYITLKHEYKLRDGKTVILYSRYKHLSEISSYIYDEAKKAEKDKRIITAGEVIGKVGNTGGPPENPYGNHLDFQFMYGGPPNDVIRNPGYTNQSQSAIDMFGNNLMMKISAFDKEYNEINHSKTDGWDDTWCGKKYFNLIKAQYAVPICNHDFDTIDGTCKNENCNVKFDYLSTYDSSDAGIYSINGLITTMRLSQEPYPDSKRLVSKLFTILAELTVKGSVKNAQGTKWLEVDYKGTTGWILASQLKKVRDLPTMISAKLTSPSGTIEAGKSHDVAGLVSSNKTISKITGWVENAAGTIVLQKVSCNPGKTEYALNQNPRTPIDSGLKFANIKEPGQYYFKLEVTAGNKTEMFSFPFTAQSSAKPTCQTPDISVNDVMGGKNVTLGCSTSGAKLYYTVDGSEPTTASMLYSVPFLLESSASVRVLAVRDGYNNSTQSRYINVPEAAMPDLEIMNTPQGVWVVLTAGEPGSILYYALDESEYTQCESGTGFYVTQDTTLHLYAQREGACESERGYYYIMASTPATPNVSTLSAEAAQGEYIHFLWNTDSAAGSYQVTLRRDGGVIHQGTQMENALNWKADDPGLYSLTAKAINAVGSSQESAAASILVHAPLRVRFLDAETEAVLNELTVAYGGTIPSVKQPSRRGYEFAGWNLRGSQMVSLNGYLYETVTENRDYIANYTPKTYTVTFLNTEGSQIVIREVEFGGAAVPPDYSASVPTGCVFSGWSVVHADDNSSLCDYTKVDANLELQAVVRWANMELPVVVTIGEASSAAGTGYVIPLTLTNWNEASSDVWVCYALKTENENGVGKTVYTDREALTLQAGETRSVSPSKVLSYAGNASLVEILVLERKSDGTTGSAYSQSASKRIIAGSSWSDWSAWSTTEPPAQDGRVIETKTQYRYRTKETTTSMEPELEGWTLSGSSTYWGEYGPWSDWTRSAITASDETQVETTALYRYYYFYCPTCGGHEPFQGLSDCKKYSLTASNWNEKWFPTPYSQSKSSTFSYTTAKRYTTSLGDGQIWCFSSANLNDTAIGTKDNHNSSNPAVIAAGYRSRTRTELTEYAYYRWSAWSSWSDQAQQQSDTVQIKSRTLYRYRDELTYYVPGQEDVSGTVHSCSGSLDIAADLNGKVATIMVYQSKNMDANQYQMKYIGQTVLGAGNSYEFSFIPSSEPTADTGNYVISLGIQGTTGLLNIGLIEAPKRSYTVQFYYVDGSDSIVLSNQTVEEGGSAAVPEAPQRPGYIFAGWSGRSTNIISNSSIEALYVPERYAVVFVDYANQTVSVQTAVAGTAIQPPPSPEAVGKTFLGWDVLINDPAAVVTGNMVVTAVYETSSYQVTFHNAAGDVIDTQLVEYGTAATPPAAPAVGNGNVFLGWDTSVMWWRVTSELHVYPIVALAETTMAPIASISNGTTGLSAYLELESEPGATIYYTMDGTEPTTESTVYTGGFYLTDTTQVLAIACRDGKNNSVITEVHFLYDETPYEGEPPVRTEIVTQEITVTPGEEYEIQVSIEDNPGLCGYMMYVDCDLSIFGLDVDSADDEVLIPGAASDGGTFSLSSHGTDGWQITWLSTEANHEDGVLFTLPIYVEEEMTRSASKAPYKIRLSYAPLYTYSEECVEAAGDFTMTITSAASVILGDVNEDGEVDANDLTALARHVARIEVLTAASQLEAADINQDGSIDAADLTSLARYVAKITTSFD